MLDSCNELCYHLIVSPRKLNTGLELDKWEVEKKMAYVDRMSLQGEVL